MPEIPFSHLLRDQTGERTGSAVYYQGLHAGLVESDTRMLKQFAANAGLTIDIQRARDLFVTAVPVLLQPARDGYPNRFMWEVDSQVLYKLSKPHYIGVPKNRKSYDEKFYEYLAEFLRKRERNDYPFWQQQIDLLRTAISDEFNLTLPHGDYMSEAEKVGVHPDPALDMRAFLLGEVPRNRPKGVSFEEWLDDVWSDASEFYLTYGVLKRQHEMKRDFSDKPWKMFRRPVPSDALEPIFTGHHVLEFQMNRFRPYHLPDVIGRVSRVVHTGGTKRKLFERNGVLTGRFIAPEGRIILEFGTFTSAGLERFYIPEAHVLEIGRLVAPERDISSFIDTPKHIDIAHKQARLRDLPENHTLRIIKS